MICKQSLEITDLREGQVRSIASLQEAKESDKTALARLTAEHMPKAKGHKIVKRDQRILALQEENHDLKHNNNKDFKRLSEMVTDLWEESKKQRHMLCEHFEK